MSPLMKKCQPKSWFETDIGIIVTMLVCGMALGFMVGFSFGLTSRM